MTRTRPLDDAVELGDLTPQQLEQMSIEEPNVPTDTFHALSVNPAEACHVPTTFRAIANSSRCRFVSSFRQYFNKITTKSIPHPSDISPLSAPRLATQLHFPLNTLTQFLGVFISIYILTTLDSQTPYQFIVVSFGATVTLLFAAPNSPMSQPKNVLGGQLLSSLISLVIRTLIPNDSYMPIRTSLAVSLSILFMSLTKLSHPPAGATALYIAFIPSDMTEQRWNGFWFLVSPVLTGNLIIVTVALVLNNTIVSGHYPDYWA